MKRGVVAQLRDIVPIRPLTREEALQIAERQAQKLLDLLGVREAPVSESVIAELPRIDVRRMSPWPVSGMAHWVGGTWAIVINGSEPITRQRFSMAHEFKHILDHLFIHVLYESETNQKEQHRWIESTCDYFAGCLLIPRPWLKRVWANQTQDIGELAEHFHVSQAAIRTRLSQTGLVTHAERCNRRTGGTSKPRFGQTRYHRRSTPLLAT